MSSKNPLSHLSKIYQMCYHMGKEDKKGDFIMTLKILNQYWVLYGMLGVFGIGLVSRLILNGILKGLLRDLRRPEGPRKKVLKQMKTTYESCCQRNEGMKDMDSFVRTSLYGNRFLGMTIDGLKRVSGQALFLCLAVGVVSSLLGYYYGAGQDILILYTGAGLGLAAGLLDIAWFLNAGGKQELLETGIYNYLENRLPLPAWEKKQTEEVPELIAEFKEKRKERDQKTNLGERDMESLRKSLEQIAAEREKQAGRKEYVPSAEDGRVVEEILQQFLG